MTSPSEIRSPLPGEGHVHRVGKLRAGLKKSSTRDGKTVTFPSAVDYFVVNADSSTSPQSAASFHEVYGDEPRELDVVLPAHTPGEVLQGAWRMYGTGGLLKRKCEGPGGPCIERASGGEWISGPCACDRDGFGLVDDKRRCQERWTLSVLLMNVTGLGVWQFDTGSSMAARDMAGMLSFIHAWRGSLLRAECKLRLVPRQVAPKGVAKTVYIAQLDASGTTPGEALALAESPGLSAPALPAPSLDEAPDELLDHEVVVVEAPVPPPPPPPPPRPAPPSPAEPGARSVALQLRDMPTTDRAELYQLAGIPRGTKAPDVRALLCARWDELDLLPFTDEPNVAFLLSELRLVAERNQAMGPRAADVEAFQIFADTGQDIEPGDQITMYGPGDPS